MTQKETIAETFRAEISSLLKTHQENIISVLAYYQRTYGKKVYEIISEPTFLTSWLKEERIQIDVYNFTKDNDVIVFIGKKTQDFYFKFVSHPKDKNL